MYSLGEAESKDFETPFKSSKFSVGGRRKKLRRGKVEERKEGEERMEGCEEEEEEGRKGLVRTSQRYDYASALGAMLNPILRTGRS